MPRFYKVILLVLIFPLSSVLAEGTKQVRPASTDYGFFQLWAASGLRFASYAANPDERLNIHIKDFSTEQIYFAFKPRNNDIYFRLRDPLGNIVMGPTLIPFTPAPGYISTHAQAVAGPLPLAAGGYSPFSYQPLMNGDYYIEFNPVDPAVLNSVSRIIDLLDITVADNSTNTAIEGRLWSKNWVFTTNGGGNVFIADLYIYTKDSVVTLMDFNGALPFGFAVACNSTGCSNTGDAVLDRQSRCGQVYYPEYKIFLNDPDNTVYPTGSVGFFSDTTTITACSNGDYCINVFINKPGQVEVLLNLNGVDGYQAGSEDVVIVSNIVQGGDCVAWDGFDGLGNKLTEGAIIPMAVEYKFGLTNFPFFDCENQNLGFIVDAVRPALATRPLLYWDDTQGCLIGGSADLGGCVTTLPSSGCHTWGNALGNNNTINTWWYVSTSTDVGIKILPPMVKVQAGIDASSLKGCAVQLDASGLVPASVAWREITSGTGLYDSKFSCLTGCLNPFFASDTTMPAFIDMQVCGLLDNPCGIMNACDTVRVFLIPSLKVAISQDSLIICSSQQRLLSAVSNAPAICSYTWKDALGNIVGFDSTYMAPASGTYKLIVIDENTPCNKDSAEFNLNFYSPQLVSAGVDKFICEGQSVLMSVSGPSIVNWSPSAGLSCSNCPNPFANPADTIMYIVQGIDSMGCPSRDSVIVAVYPPSYSTADSLVCKGTSLDGFAINNDTTYTVNLIANNGCDSIVTRIITVKAIKDTIVTAEVCNGQSYEGNTIAQDTTYNTILIANNGCDSVVTKVITVKQPAYTSVVAAICQGQIYEGNIINQDTTYNSILIARNGCDSIVSKIITVNLPQASNVDVSICQGEMYEGITINQDTTYYTSLIAANGCDSVVTKVLTVKFPQSSIVTAAVCKGQSYEGNIINRDTIYNTNLIASNECDSIVSKIITVKYPKVSTLSLAICRGDIYEGNTINRDTSYNTSLVAANGCDSIVTKVITIKFPQTSTVALTVCKGQVYEGSVINQDTTYNTNFIAANGCDSIVTKSITVKQLKYTTIAAELCQGQSYEGNVINQDTTYNTNLVAANGCDSIITKVITAKLPKASTITVAICKGQTYEGNVINQDTTYYISLIAVNGCDSIVTKVVTVKLIKNETVKLTICYGALLNGVPIKSDTVIFSVYTAANGCDSNVTREVTVVRPIITSEELQLCEGTIFNGYNMQNDTTIIKNNLSYQGCDSLHYINVQVNRKVSSAISANICRGNSYEKVTIKNDTIISRIYLSAKGCDSTVVINIKAIDKKETNFYSVKCFGSYYKGFMLTKDTILISSYTSNLGCDSIVKYAIRIAYPSLSQVDTSVCENSIFKGVVISKDTSITEYGKNIYGCDSLIRYLVRIFESPQMEISRGHRNNGKEIKLTALGKGFGELTYSWQLNNNMICKGCSEIEVNPVEDTEYFVSVRDQRGCSSEKSIKVDFEINCSEGLDFPNAMTPNDDGYNDYVYFKNESSVEIKSMKIYDRWGELMFESKNATDKWDGTFRNQSCNPGVYVYYLEGVCASNPFYKVGNFTIIK